MKIHLTSVALLCNVISGQSLHHGDEESSTDPQNGRRRLRKSIAAEYPFHRHLQNLVAPDELPCNEPYDTWPIGQIQGTLAAVFNASKTSVGPLPEIDTLLTERIPAAEFAVQFMKVCASCESEGLHGYGCDENDYGYDTTHSGLVMLPVEIDPVSKATTVIDAETLDTWFHHKFVTSSPASAAFVVYNPGAFIFEYALLASAFGYVSIVPDTMGYGMAASLVPSVSDQKSLATAIMPLYAKVKDLLKTESKGRTELSDMAVYMGASGGGFSAVAAADKFQSYGITPIRVLAGAAPIKSRSWAAMGVVRSTLAGQLNTFDPLSVAVIGLALSGTRKGLSTSNTTQTMLKADKVVKLSEMLRSPEAPLSMSKTQAFTYFSWAYSTYPEIFPVVSNPSENPFPLDEQAYLSDNTFNFFKTALMNKDDDPCLNKALDLEELGMDLICADLDNSDLTTVALEAEYPIELCNGKTDPLVVIENVPSPELLKYELDDVNHSESSTMCLVKMFEGMELKKATLRATKPPKSTKATKALKPSKTTKKSKAGKRA